MKFETNIDLNKIISIIGITALGYISAYFYQLGKFTYLNIPIFLIEISPDLAIFSVLITVFIILVVSFVAFIINKVPDTTKNVSKIKKSNFWHTLVGIIITLLVFNFFIIKYSDLPSFSKSLFVSILDVGLPIVIFIPPFFYFPKTKGYINKYNLFSEKEYQEKVAKIRLQNKSSSPASHVFALSQAYIPVNYIYIFIFFFLWTMLPFYGGFSEMSSSKKLPIVFENGPHLFAGKYNGSYILVPVDLKEKKILNRTVLKSSDKELYIIQTEVGELTKAN